MTDSSPINPFEPNRAVTTAAAGWYSDGTTPGVERWWNGSAWTEHTHDLTRAAVAPASPAPTLAAGTSPYTPFAWIIALLPVLSTISYLTWDPSGFVSALVERSATRAGSSAASMNVALYSDLGPGYAVSVVVGWLIVAVTVVLAYFDYRSLGRRGFGRRFHWAFTFLLGFGAIVYLIGRSVIVRSQVGRGMAVMWVYIVIWAVSVVVISTRFVLAFVAAAPLMHR